MVCAGHRRSPGRPYRLLLVAAVSGWALTGAGAIMARAGGADPFVEEKPGVSVDWRRGSIEATGGAAADHRMPSAEVARPGAERRARAAARARMADALRALPLGGGRRLDEGALSRVLARARDAGIDYQSNGGALVHLAVAFGDWSERDAATSASGTPLAILLSEGHLAAAPVVVVGGHEITLDSVRYAPATAIPSGEKPLAARADKKGRLLLDDSPTARKIAERSVLIYVQKLLR